MHAFRKILKVGILLRLFLYVCIHRHKRKAYKNITRTWRSVRAIDNVFLSPVARPGLFCFIFLDDVKSWLWSKEIIFFWFPHFFLSLLDLCGGQVTAANSNCYIFLCRSAILADSVRCNMLERPGVSSRHAGEIQFQENQKKHADFYSRRRRCWCCCCCKRS